MDNRKMAREETKKGNSMTMNNGEPGRWMGLRTKDDAETGHTFDLIDPVVFSQPFHSVVNPFHLRTFEKIKKSETAQKTDDNLVVPQT